MDRIVSARVEAQRWYVRFPRAVPVGIFLLTMAITVLSVFAIERVEAERKRSQMREVAGSVASALMRRSIAQVTYLKAGAILFADGRPVTGERFGGFAHDLDSNAEFRSPDGISWIAKVPRAQIPAFVAFQRAGSAPDYTFRPELPPGRDFALPIAYFGSFKPKPNGLGRDIYADLPRRAALDEAARTHLPTATGKLVLHGANGKATWIGFIVYMPVFAGSRAGGPLLGYIAAPFDAAAFLGSALEIEHVQGFAIGLYDGDPSAANRLAQINSGPPGGGNMARPMAIAGHRFTIVVSALQPGTLSALSLVTLLFGIMVASLLTIMARLLTSQAEEDRASLNWLREQSSIRNSLTRELNHRVKNTLANVLSIIALTSRRSTDLGEFVDSLNGRIRALSATHDLLTDLEWGATPLRGVVCMELAPYSQDNQHDVVIDGPEVSLAPNDALSLGLAIHELATNASKYGALSVPSGRVVVGWESISPELVRVSWRESGGPPVSQQRRRGFGTDLIERIVAQELGGGVDLRFDPEGVRCSLTVPVRQPAAFQIRAPK